VRYLESINQSLHQLLLEDDQVILIGEDLHDPYGGAFKVTQGLSSKFPGRVISTPISEAAITGAAVGMAMRGMKPILEIMFGDFLALCMDQIVNHASKYKWMFNDQVSVPIIIRAPMGGGRGYGPTHSQSLESMFMSVPGVTIAVPSIFNDPGKMLKNFVDSSSDPVLFIENKISYPKKLILGESVGDFKIRRMNDPEGYENVFLSMFPEEKEDFLIVTYGGMVEIAMQAANEIFMEEEILCSILICNNLKPIPMSILDFAKNANQVLILEEGNKIGGWGAELSSVISENCFQFLDHPIIRIGAEDMPIPSSMTLESAVLPSVAKIKQTITKLVHKS